MDLRKLSDRMERWISAAWTGCTSTHPDRWQDAWERLSHEVEEEFRLIIGGDDTATYEPFDSVEAWRAEGSALFDELSKLTESPMRARRLRGAMETFGASIAPGFSLRGGVAKLSLIPGGASSNERPSERYIDEPEAG